MVTIIMYYALFGFGIETNQQRIHNETKPNKQGNQKSTDIGSERKWEAKQSEKRRLAVLFFAKNSPHQQKQMCRELARQWALKHGSSVNPSVMLGRVKKTSQSLAAQQTMLKKVRYSGNQTTPTNPRREGYYNTIMQTHFSSKKISWAVHMFFSTKNCSESEVKLCGYSSRN